MKHSWNRCWTGSFLARACLCLHLYFCINFSVNEKRNFKPNFTRSPNTKPWFNGEVWRTWFIHKQILHILLMPLDNSPPACRVCECVQGWFERETTCTARLSCILVFLTSNSSSAVLYWMEAGDASAGWSLHHCNSLRQLTLSKSLVSSWERSMSEKSVSKRSEHTSSSPYWARKKRQRERGKGHVSQTLRSEQNSQAVSFFEKKIKSQQYKSRFVEQEPKKLEVPITAGEILGENPACARHCWLVLSLRSQRICFLCNQCSMKHTLPNMGNDSVPLMRLPRPVFSVKLLETRA